jgi:hypothetical protein
MRYATLRAGLISIPFLCLIAFPLINDRLSLVNDIKSSENRKHASRPEINIDLLDPFPAAYEKYYNDTFSLRNRLILNFQRFSCTVLKKSPFPQYAIIGKQGWLFLKGVELETYTGEISMTEEEFEKFGRELECRKHYLEKRGCKLYVMIIPVKPVIYPEFLPAEIFRLTYNSLGERLQKYLDVHCSVKTVNLYKAFTQNKSPRNLYCKLDNHWNHEGAFLAANEALSRIREDHPNLEPLSRDSFEISKSVINGGNTLAMLGNLNVFTDTSYSFKRKNGHLSFPAEEAGYHDDRFAYKDEYEQVRETKDTGLPVLLIISDSFGENIFDFLSEDFRKTVKIWDNWEYKLNEDIVEKEKPDAMLLMIYEKNLPLFLPHAKCDNR